MPRILITVLGKNPQPYRLPLDRAVTRFGRAADNDVLIDDPSVSSHHCELRRVSGAVQLVDLDSTNGIRSGSQRMQVIDITNDDQSKIGDAMFEIIFSDDELETLRDEPHQTSSIPSSHQDVATETVETPTPELDQATLTPSDSIQENTRRESIKPNRKENTEPTEEAPAPSRYARKPNSPSASSYQPAASSFGFGDLILLLILAALAFYAGLTIRHYLETQRFLPSEMFGL